MAGADTENGIKQGHEFGLNKSMTICALLIQVRGVRAGAGGGARPALERSYYWDLNDRTRPGTIG